MTKTAPFDPVDYLHNEAQITAYLQVAAEEAAEYGDNSILTDAIRIAARARGMADLARAAGLPQESLDKTLQEAAALSKILAALGVKIALNPIS
jgi:probable addiction module antidote protein